MSQFPAFGSNSRTARMRDEGRGVKAEGSSADPSSFVSRPSRRSICMKVLVIGKGGREHALVWKLSQSPRVERVFCAPGNAGTAQDGVNVPIEVNDFDRLVRWA